MKSKQIKSVNRLAAFAVSIVMLASCFTPMLNAVHTFARENSSDRKADAAKYGNERVETSDYTSLPMSEDGSLVYEYGTDCIQNGNFDGFVREEEEQIPKNLISGGGTFEGVLQEGQNETAIGTSFTDTVAGAWGNQNWADSYGCIINDGGNSVVKIGYTTAGWAHAIFNFENQGAGKYRVQFDYRNNSDGLNAYMVLGESNTNVWADQIYDERAGTELNLFSGIWFKGVQVGTPIENSNWLHFDRVIDTENAALEIMRIFVWTNFDPTFYLLVDNISVTKVEEPKPAEPLTYLLQENDPSGWTTTGEGTVSGLPGENFDLTVRSETEAITSKTIFGYAGKYQLDLKYKAEDGAKLSVEFGDNSYNLLDCASTEDNGYQSVSVILESESEVNSIKFHTQGTVVLDDVILRGANIDYGAMNSLKEVKIFSEENLTVGGGTYENYLKDSETEVIVQSTPEQAIDGVWSNKDWPDSPAKIVKDGNNSYIKVGYVQDKGGFAHVIQTFENPGANNYLVEFDYFTSGTTDNCCMVINDRAFIGGTTVLPVFEHGTAIEGKEGWYHFSTELFINSKDVRYLRLWYNTANSAENYILLDNISVKAQKGVEYTGAGNYDVPAVRPQVPANIWTFESDTPSVLVRENNNVVAKMAGNHYSSFFYGFTFEKAGVYAFSFDFKPEGNSDNIGCRINPVDEKYPFDIPLLQYKAQWEQSELGSDWYHFVYYLKIDHEVAYKDASLQFWCHCANHASLSVDNLSVRRLISADVTGNPVWGKERIADGTFTSFIGNRESYTVPNHINRANKAITGIWTSADSVPVTVEYQDNRFVAKLAGTSGNAAINHAVSLQNEGTYKVSIRYRVPEGYAEQSGAALTYAFNGTTPVDILKDAVADENGWAVFTQNLKMTAEEADSVSEIGIRFACVQGYEADIDFVSVRKEIGSDIPQEGGSSEETEGKVRRDFISGGDFEKYPENTKFDDAITEDMFGTIALDMPAEIITNDTDTTNPSKVMILRFEPGSSKDFSSAFNMYTSVVEIEKGRTYYISFDYKYHIDEPLDTEIIVGDGRHFTMDKGFTFCFVGGTNIGHHEINLGSVKDGDMTVGANNQKCPVSKEDLGDGWARISFSFTANTGLKVACNTIRFLLLTNGNPNNYAMFDNVQMYSYFDAEELPPVPDHPDDQNPDSQDQEDVPGTDVKPDEPKETNGCNSSGCGSSFTVGSAILAATIGMSALCIMKRKK